MLASDLMSGTVPAHRPDLQFKAAFVDERFDVPFGFIIASSDVDVRHRSDHVVQLERFDEVVIG